MIYYNTIFFRKLEKQQMQFQNCKLMLQNKIPYVKA